MGVEYLYSQTGKTWSPDVSRLDPDEPDELTDYFVYRFNKRQHRKQSSDPVPPAHCTS